MFDSQGDVLPSLTKEGFVKAVRIGIDKPLVVKAGYRDWHRARGLNTVLRPGEQIEGHVDVDRANPRQAVYVRWVDSYGRLCDRVRAEWKPESGQPTFTLILAEPVTMVNYLECEIGGQVEAERCEFHVRPATDGWEEFPVFAWANYPVSAANLLRQIGVDSTIINKGADDERVLKSNMRFYAEQLSPDEISLYHRPYTLSWDPVEKPVYPDRTKFFQLNWEWLRKRYKDRRAMLGNQSMAQDVEGQKILWRAQCLNRPDTRWNVRKRLEYLVNLRKAYRPAYYSIGDEPGLTDQAAPFDFCYCPFCMEKMRVWLEQKYGTLAALNAQWGTAFAAWDDVLPLTTDDTMRLIQANGETDVARYNLSSWCDHRAFNDDSVAGMYDFARNVIHEIDPFAVAGIEGGQLPTTFGGWDYAKLVRSMDIIEHYNYGQNDEVIRSLTPHIRKLICFFGTGDAVNQRMWYQVIHGDVGQIHYDVGHRFVDPVKKTLTKDAEVTAPTLREIKGGIAKQLSLMDRLPERVGIHYSHPSLNVLWLLEALPEGENWIDRNSDEEDDPKRRRSVVLRDAWCKVLEDLQLQYRFVAYDDLESANLLARGYRAFILPQSVSMTARECAALRRFVEGGGVLIADARPAIFDGRGKGLGAGQLDDLFGVTRKDLVFTEDAPALELTAAAKDLGLEPGKLVLTALEPGVRAADEATAYAKAGNADALIVRKVGAGAAVYLNAGLYPYSQGRYDVDQPVERQPQDLVMAALRLAGVESEATVVNRAGRRLPGAEVTGFRAGPVEFVTVVTNGAVLYGGVGQEMKGRRFEYPASERATVNIGVAGHLYNQRTGEYLGETNEVTLPWKPAEPIILARLPYQVTGLKAKAAVKNGRAEYTLRLDTTAAPGTHAVRVDVYIPDGTWRPHYSKNVVVEGGAFAGGFRLALNDPKGAWRLTARDAVTGARTETTFQVR
jgi:hypothetical protein